MMAHLNKTAVFFALLASAMLLTRCSQSSSFKNSAVPKSASTTADSGGDSGSVGNGNLAGAGGDGNTSTQSTGDDPLQKVVKDGALTDTEQTTDKQETTTVTTTDDHKATSTSTDTQTVSATSTSTGTTTVTKTATSTQTNTDNVVHTTAKVGINFEDGGPTGSISDKDYNDAVLCFVGKFAVDYTAGTIQSDAAQTVAATFSRHADCNNYMRITVLDSTGKTTFTHDYTTANGSEQTININFNKGDALKVNLITGSGCNNYGKVIGFDNKDWAIFAADECRTSGN